MRSLLLKFLNFYQKYISKFFEILGVKCKYYPSCSEYARQAILKYGCIKGTFFSIKRVCKCNPLSKGGYDPLK